ncbi:MtrAB system response regulator MtrA [soil metagenome]
MGYRRTNRDRVLVVDDDASLAEMLTIVLGNYGLKTSICINGNGVMEAFASFKPDIVLLDLMLPGLDGMAVCKQIRDRSDVPIIMLTAKSETGDVVRGLEAGADDYITKPFKSQELVARVRARLRRTDELSETLVFGDIVLDPAGHHVTRKGEALDLTPLEFDLLACLLGSPDKVFSRETLLQKVWGYHHPGDTKLVNVHMTRLRSKIEDDAENPQVIRTVRGIGYQAVTS